jgi:uncharacterized protein YbjT (DUF2867 family)
MKIVVIGGSGFVGTQLIGLLRKSEGTEVVNIDKRQSEHYPDITRIGDVLHQEDLLPNIGMM